VLGGTHHELKHSIAIVQEQGKSWGMFVTCTHSPFLHLLLFSWACNNDTENVNLAPGHVENPEIPSSPVLHNLFVLSIIFGEQHNILCYLFHIKMSFIFVDFGININYIDHLFCDLISCIGYRY